MSISLLNRLWNSFRESRHWFWTLGRFGFSGGLSALVFIGIYWSVISIDTGFSAELNNQLATIAGLTASFVFIFFVNKYFTFLSGESRHTGRELAWFIAGRSVSNFLIYLPGMHYLVEVRGIAWLHAVILIALPALVFNFLFERFITFRLAFAD
jgi:putative flippase GtrA